MSKIFSVLILFIAVSFSSSAQSTPDVVLSTFNSKFPKAESVRWEKENDIEWEAEFKVKGQKMSANFSLDGKWKETEAVISKEKLPAGALKNINDSYAGYEIKKVETVDTPKFSGYEVKISNGSKTKKLVFDKNGKNLSN